MASLQKFKLTIVILINFYLNNDKRFFSGELANIEEENITTLNCEEKMPEEAAQAALSAKESNQSSQSKYIV